MEEYLYSLLKNNYNRKPEWFMIYDIDENDVKYNSLLTQKQKELCNSYKKMPDSLKDRLIVPDHLLWVDVNKKPILNDTDFRFFAYYIKKKDWFKELDLTPWTDAESPYHLTDKQLQVEMTLSSFVCGYSQEKSRGLVKKKMDVATTVDVYSQDSSRVVFDRCVGFLYELAEIQAQQELINKKIETTKKYVEEQTNKGIQIDDKIIDFSKREIENYFDSDIIGNLELFRYVYKYKNGFYEMKPFDSSGSEFETHFVNLLAKLNKVEKRYNELGIGFSSKYPIITLVRINNLKKEIENVIKLGTLQKTTNGKIMKNDESFDKKVENNREHHLTRVRVLENALIIWINKQLKPCYCGGCDGTSHSINSILNSSSKTPVKSSKPIYKFAGDKYWAYVIDIGTKEVNFVLKNDAGDYFEPYLNKNVKNGEKEVIHFDGIKTGEMNKETQYEFFSYAYETFHPNFIYNLWVIQTALDKGRDGVFVNQHLYYFKEKIDTPLPKEDKDLLAVETSKNDFKLELPLSHEKITTFPKIRSMIVNTENVLLNNFKKVNSIEELEEIKKYMYRKFNPSNKSFEITAQIVDNINKEERDKQIERQKKQEEQQKKQDVSFIFKGTGARKDENGKWIVSDSTPKKKEEPVFLPNVSIPTVPIQNVPNPKVNKSGTLIEVPIIELPEAFNEDKEKKEEKKQEVNDKQIEAIQAFLAPSVNENVLPVIKKRKKLDKNP